MPPTYVFGDDARMFVPVPTAVATASGTLGANSLVPCDTTSGAQTQTLPAAPADRTVVAVVLAKGSNSVTVACAGSDVFLVAGGATSAVISTVGASAWWMYNAAAHIWYEVASVGSSSGGSGVSSFNTRTGAVVPASADYAFSQISGTASIAQGGTGQTGAVAAFNALSPLTTLGDSLSNDGTNDVRVAGNITATRKFLRQTGTGSVSALPAWDTLVAADVPTLNQNTTGSAASVTGSFVGDMTGTQGATVVGKVQGVAINANQATIVSNLTNATTRSATATVNPGEETIFTGSTASQTLTLPVTPTVSTVNTVTNTASVSVTLAPGAGATLSNFGTSGNVVIPSGYTFAVVYIGTTWYVQSAGPSDFAKGNPLAIANGGTGSTTQQAAINTLTGTQSAAKYMRSDGTNATLSALAAADLTGTVAVAHGGTGHTIAPVTSTGATTVTGVTAATALASGLTVPISTLATGQVYEFAAWGVMSTTVSGQTFTFNLNWGGLAGTSVMTWGASNPNSSGTVSNGAWNVEFRIVLNSATSMSVMGWLSMNYFFASITQQVTTVANTSAEQFVLGVTPSATAASITCNGFVSERKW